MADLSPKTVRRFLDVAGPRVAELTGLPPDRARTAAVSLIPPAAINGAHYLLRDGEGRDVGRVLTADISPVAILQSIATP